MGETEVKLVSRTYMLNNGNCRITAIIGQDGKLSLLHNTSQYGHSKEFIFENSKPEMVYTIGTLIRDAADLASTP